MNKLKSLFTFYKIIVCIKTIKVYGMGKQGAT